MLGLQAEGAGFRFVHHPSIGSTMDEAVALARAGDKGRIWVVADRQIAGRGRHGRQWESPVGNLYTTLLLVDPCPMPQAPQLGFVAGLALRDAIVEMTALGDRIKLKWPNDLLVDGKKIAGVLLEGISLGVDGGRSKQAIAIGIGVNVAHHPVGLPYATTSLAALGYIGEPLELLQHLSNKIVARLAQWSAGEDFALIRGAWTTAAAGRGEVIEVALTGRRVRGIFSEIDRAGRLIIETENGSQSIDAGDVMLRGESV